MTYRELKRRVGKSDMSFFIQEKISSQLGEIVSDNNRLAKLLGFIYEFLCSKGGPLRITKSEYELLSPILSRLRGIKDLNLMWYGQFLAVIHRELKDDDLRDGCMTCIRAITI